VLFICRKPRKHRNGRWLNCKTHFVKEKGEQPCTVLGVVPKLIHGRLPDCVVILIMSFLTEVLHRMKLFQRSFCPDINGFFHFVKKEKPIRIKSRPLNQPFRRLKYVALGQRNSEASGVGFRHGSNDITEK